MGEFFRVKDFNLKDKTVAIRIDMNLPYNPETGELSENPRLYKHVETIRKLQKERAKIILLSHQGRKGEPDFISLEKHSKLLEKHLNREIKFLKFSSDFEVIKKLKEREILVLDNSRFYRDEKDKKRVEEHAESSLPKKLSPYIDYFVLDAFSIAHRCHASVVGFAGSKPCIAGPVFELELKELEKFLNKINFSKNDVFILGGAKPKEPLDLITHLLSKNVEKILTTGVLSLLFLIAKGYKLGETSENFLKEKGYLDFLPEIKKTLEKNRVEIVVPLDVAVEREKNRVEVPVEDLPVKERILDIGSKTIGLYREEIRNSTNVFMKGPAGVYENKNGLFGTKSIFEILEHTNSVLAGGNTVDALSKLNIPFDRFNYVSLGGGAATEYLLGKELPGLKSLELSFDRVRDKSSD